MNEEHLDRLQNGGIGAWNAWRLDNPGLRPDLRGARINSLAARSPLSRHGSIFQEFETQRFQSVDLHDADLRSARLWSCDFGGASLHGADLRDAELRRTGLQAADLSGSDVRGTQFLLCDLSRANLTGATFGATHFGHTPLQGAQGLDNVRHEGASQLDQFSIITSMPLSFRFMLACNVDPDTVYMAEFHTRSQYYYTCFISYSRSDEAVVAQLRHGLTRAGVPSWFAPLDMRDEKLQQGETELQRDLFTYIDAADRVVLVMSPRILPSAWVGMEIGRMRPGQPLIPLLIETMPIPGSPEWDTILPQPTEHGAAHLLNPRAYSDTLSRLLTGPVVDFRGSTDPTQLAERLPTLLAFLTRVP
jgi:hypothetical protein